MWRLGEKRVESERISEFTVREREGLINDWLDMRNSIIIFIDGLGREKR